MNRAQGAGREPRTLQARRRSGPTGQNASVLAFIKTKLAASGNGIACAPISAAWFEVVGPARSASPGLLLASCGGP